MATLEQAIESQRVEFEASRGINRSLIDRVQKVDTLLKDSGAQDQLDELKAYWDSDNIPPGEVRARPDRVELVYKIPTVVIPYEEIQDKGRKLNSNNRGYNDVGFQVIRVASFRHHSLGSQVAYDCVRLDYLYGEATRGGYDKVNGKLSDYCPNDWKAQISNSKDDDNQCIFPDNLVPDKLREALQQRLVNLVLRLESTGVFPAGLAVHHEFTSSKLKEDGNWFENREAMVADILKAKYIQA